MSRNFKHLLLIALMLSFPVVPARARPVSTAPAQTASQDSLYKRLGGYDALAAVSDDFLGRLASDPKEGRFFVGLGTDSRTRVRQHIVDFLCVATGGPCKYTGRDMVTAHTGLGITEEDWTIMVGQLQATFNKFKVPANLQQEVLGALRPLKGQIAGR